MNPILCRVKTFGKTIFFNAFQAKIKIYKPIALGEVSTGVNVLSTGVNVLL